MSGFHCLSINPQNDSDRPSLSEFVPPDPSLLTKSGAGMGPLTQFELGSQKRGRALGRHNSDMY